MNTSPWAKADLHIHTTYSDGTATVAETLTYAVEHTDLRVIAITDHDCIDGALEACRIAPRYGIDVIPGIEVSTANGHLLALFVHKPIPAHRPVKETIDLIHEMGGLAVAPHPFDRLVPSLGNAGSMFECWDFDALEVFNAGVYWTQRGANNRAQDYAGSRQLPMLGNSDSHSLSTIGQGYTRFEGRSANDVYHAIKNGKVTWGGQYWRAQQHAGAIWRSIRQRGLFRLLYWAAVTSRIPTHAG